MMPPNHSRALAPDELEQLAAHPERWRHLVRHRPDERTYAQLHGDQHVAIWLIAAGRSPTRKSCGPIGA